MELTRPFSWRINAVNPEATTRKEQEKFSRIRDNVVQQIMQPIRVQIETKAAEENKGRKLSPEETQQLQQAIDQEMKSQTPEEVDHYMKRKHQDPAEILMNQLFNYVTEEQKVKEKFNEGWKHAGISAKEIYWVGSMNGRPKLNVINPINFSYDKNSDVVLIQHGEWAGVELWMTPSQVVEYFGSEMTNTQIDSLYTGYADDPNRVDFSFDESDSNGKIRVVHRTWRALRKIGFLAYVDPNTEELEERLVDEGYKLNPEQGDVNIVWEWIPEIYEGYKINKDIYARLGPVESQPKNMENLYDSPLPYIGGIYDNLNSRPTSLIDRMKPYQFYYNIIMYRIEMLMASDKGKWLLLNMNMIPKAQGIDMKQWLYYTDALKIGFMNPNEEGNQGADVSTSAKEIDMSLISDIQKYIELAEYIAKKCGDTVGITQEMEGRIGQYQSVKNTEQSIVQSNYIVEPYFDFHNIIKREALTALMHVSALVYSTNEVEVLNYILDDFSKELIKVDKTLLSMSQYGLFVGNSMDTIKIKEAINNLGLTAMQNQTIDMSDVVKVLKTDSVTEAEEQLEVAEKRKRDQANEMERERMAHEKEMAKEVKALRQDEWEHEKEIIILKEEERRKTEIQKQTILAMGFAEDKDVNNNNQPDVLEVADKLLDVNLKLRKQNLDEEKFDHQKDVDKKKDELETKKLNKQSQNKA